MVGRLGCVLTSGGQGMCTVGKIGIAHECPFHFQSGLGALTLRGAALMLCEHANNVSIPCCAAAMCPASKELGNHHYAGSMHVGQRYS
jgi:hypothetical protein